MVAVLNIVLKSEEALQTCDQGLSKGSFHR